MDIYKKLGALANYFSMPTLARNKCSIILVENPGWAVEIDLKNTIITDVNFPPIVYGINADDSIADYNNWYFCYIKDNVFHGGCAPDKLIKILGIFFDLLEKYDFNYSQYSSVLDRPDKLFWSGVWAIIHEK